MLMSSVSVSNCIKFYQTAEDIGAEGLRKYCEEIITSHWVKIRVGWFRVKTENHLIKKNFTTKSAKRKQRFYIRRYDKICAYFRRES